VRSVLTPSQNAGQTTATAGPISSPDVGGPEPVLIFSTDIRANELYRERSYTYVMKPYLASTIACAKNKNDDR
jgi:hypothetical protein